MTEEEAKTKWCPYAAGCSDLNPQQNRACIASNCMMWRSEAVSIQKFADDPNYIRGGRCGLTK